MKAPSGNEYTINGYVNEQNIVDRVETWLGENIMGDMHILATYTGWKDFGGVMAPSKIVQTRGGWPFFEVDVTAAKANPPDVATSSQHSLRVAVEAVVVAERPVAALLVVLLLAVAVAVVKAAALRLVLLAGLLLVVPALRLQLAAAKAAPHAVVRAVLRFRRLLVALRLPLALRLRPAVLAAVVEQL